VGREERVLNEIRSVDFSLQTSADRCPREQTQVVPVVIEKSPERLSPTGSRLRDELLRSHPDEERAIADHRAMLDGTGTGPSTGNRPAGDWIEAKTRLSNGDRFGDGRGGGGSGAAGKVTVAAKNPPERSGKILAGSSVKGPGPPTGRPGKSSPSTRRCRIQTVTMEMSLPLSGSCRS